jgi:mRNA interferase RelE/StbE
VGARSVRIRWERRAVRELDALPGKDWERVIAEVESLARAPLKGELLHAEWQGLRRLRVGRYRVIYAFDGQTLLIAVLRVGHRREVYR